MMSRRAARCYQREVKGLAAVVVALGATSAGAKPLPPLVSWRAPVGCGDEVALRASIGHRARLQRSDGNEPYAIAIVTVDESGATAHLRIKSAHGIESRDVHGANCGEVSDAVAWVVALAWTPSNPIAVTTAVPDPVPDMEPRAPIVPHLAVRSALDAGTLPRGDAGIGLVAGLARAHFEIELAATLWATRFEPVMTGANAGVDVGLATVAAQACTDLVFACVGVEAGRLDGQGVALDAGRGAQLTWTAATFSGRWRRPLGRSVRLVVDLGLVVPLRRPTFLLDDASVAFRPAAVSARAGMALEFTPFW